MDKQQIGLKLALDAVGLPVALKSFDDRLIVQKAVCLLQSAGVQLGYHFHWYLRGPYSPGLTRDAFAVASELEENRDDSSGWSFDPSSRDRLERLRGLFTAPGRSELADRLELLGSIVFLVERGRVAASDTRGLRETLERYGKRFTDEQISAAVRDLKQHELITTTRP